MPQRSVRKNLLHAQLQQLCKHVSHLLLAQLSVFLLQLLLQAPYGRGNLRARLWRIFRYRDLMQGRNKTTAGGGGVGGDG